MRWNPWDHEDAVPGDPHVVVQRGDHVWVGCEDGTIAVYRFERVR